MVIARHKKVPIKLVSMWHERLMMNVVVLKSSGIKTVKDLEGKNLGVTIGDAIHRNWPIFAEAAGLKKVNFVSMRPAAKNPSLLSKTVDGILTYATVTLALRVMAEKRGDDVKEFLLGDYGVNVAQDGIIAHDKRIAENPDEVRRLVAASLQGNAWAIENPKEGVNIFQKHIPDSKPEDDDAFLGPQQPLPGLGEPEEARAGIHRPRHHGVHPECDCQGVWNEESSRVG